MSGLTTEIGARPVAQLLEPVVGPQVVAHFPARGEEGDS